MKSSFRSGAEDVRLERICDLFDDRFGGRPESQDPSESTEASDCDMTLMGAPGLTGESDLSPGSDPTWRSERCWLLRRAAMMLVEGTSGDCTRESGGDRGNSGRSSLNLDIVRRGTLEGLRIWIG